MNKSILAMALGVSISAPALAADLQPGDRLTITSGSYFVFGAVSSSTIPIVGEEHLLVGPAYGDTGTGSHLGAPTTDDIGAVTQHWSFFCNTGYDFLSINYGSGSFGGGTADGVDMSSWTATWNGIAEIPLGGCSVVANGCTQGSMVVSDTGIGEFNWDGGYGGVYTIDYTSHIPFGDPSNFGGVQYDLHLTGVVVKADGPLPPTTHVTVDFPDGNAYLCESGGATVTATANIITSDVNDIVSVDWALDGASIGSGNSLTTFVPLGSHDISVVVNTIASGLLANSQTVSVNDNTAPVITAGFISTRTGEEVTVLSDGAKSALKSGNVTIQYSATDACDSNPQVEATLGVGVANGDKIKLNRGANKLMLQGDDLADSVVLTVIATDSSGRMATLKKALSQ